MQMITPEMLLNMAVYHDMLAREADSGMTRYVHQEEMTRAMIAAAEMETNGIKEIRVFGPYGTIPKKGDRVRIKAGSKISSTSKRLARVLTRAYTVTVYNCDEGWISSDARETVIRHPQVQWVGTNGYWCWTDASNVEYV